MIKTAILVDGGFYRKRASYLWGQKDADQRAAELYSYCRAHIEDFPKDKPDEQRHLYRVLYYDCMPIKKSLYHPLEKRNIDYGRSDTYKWMETFLEQLKRLDFEGIKNSPLNAQSGIDKISCCGYNTSVRCYRSDG